jgi:Flp pilus assembly protein TadD
MASVDHPAQPTPDDCWRNASAAAQAGDMANAEKWFRECYARKPDYPNAALNVGILLTLRGSHAEAETFLQEAVKLNATIESVSALANLMQVTGRVDAARQLYKDIVKAIPAHAPSLAKLGEISELKSDRREARAYYRQALEASPSDVATGVKYATLTWADEPAETVAVFERLLAGAQNDNQRIYILTQFLTYKEFHERLKRGLMPYHATSIDEMFFKFAAPEFARFRDIVLKIAAEDKGTIQSKFVAHFCAREWREAQEALVKLAPAIAGTIWETISFDPAFYHVLEGFTDADILQGLPPLTEAVTAIFDDAPIAYLSCNYTYFANFCAPMLRSLADKAPGSQVHVHIMDVSPPQLAAATQFCQSLGVLRVALSAEQSGVDPADKMAARCYYHAIRFIRYYMHLKHYGRTLWLMDVDALFNRDPRHMYSVLGGNDAAMRIRAGRVEPWNQFNACIVAATPKPASTEYFRLLAAYIAYFHQRKQLRWGIDQLAMYGVYEYLKAAGRAPTLAFLDDRAIDYEYLDDGIVWCNSGKNKFSHLNRNPDGSLVVDDPDRAKYIKLFDKYFTPPKA